MMDANSTGKPAMGGWVGFVVEALRRGRVGLSTTRAVRTLKLVETLSLGGKRQVMLVSCGERMFLVGVGADGVQTIVPVADEVRL